MSRVDGLVDFFDLKIDSDDLVIDLRARDWCNLPYENHPKGCPNYGDSEHCPDKVCTIDDYIDLEDDMYFLVAEFDMATYIERVSEAHPNWSKRRKKCVLYWQSSVEKKLRNYVEEFRSGLTYDNVCTLIPEAMGVHVFRTLLKKGVDIKPDPDDTLYKVAMLGKPMDDDCIDYMKK